MVQLSTVALAAGITQGNAPILAALNGFFNQKANGITAVDIDRRNGKAVLVLSSGGENYGTSQTHKPVDELTKVLRQEVTGLDAYLKTLGL